MTITYHNDLLQGSDEWHEARRGILTASEMKLILTPNLKLANNDKTRSHVHEIAAQRITGYTEPSYIGDDMLRGWEDEITARELYSANIQPIVETGFVTNDEWGFTIGYSPDGLIGDDGLWENKSRKQKYQIETIATGEVPQEHVMQLQTGLLVTGRKLIVYNSYSGGLPMCPILVFPDPEIQAAIVTAATAFECQVLAVIEKYHANVKAAGYLPTERRIEQEMHV